MKAKEGSSARPGKGRVLVAEDEEPFRRYVVRVLKSEGYEPLEAADGMEALKALQGGAAVDLVISDLIMPELGGAGLAKEVAKKYPGLKVLLISGYVDNVEEISKDLGFEAFFLRKPFTPDELMTAVKAL
jgi:two-component system cell cycle sensor histidine kinase/response regulator CckA